MANNVFITGGTGYIGSRLIPALLARGHAVTTLARRGSEAKVPPGARVALGDALEAASLRAALGDSDTWIQLIGTPRPGPHKAAEFRGVDRQAVIASAQALPGSAIRHYIYLSVAQPSRLMRAYVQVRAEGEKLLRRSGVPATFVRPWYVLGPGHRWPYALIPLYKLMEIFPATRTSALRMGLVTLPQMLAALIHAVEHPPASVQIVEVPDIRLSPRLLSLS